MITELSFTIRLGLLFGLSLLTLRYSARGLQNGVLLLLATSLFPMSEAVLVWEGSLPILTLERVVWPLLLLTFLVQWRQGKIKTCPPDSIEYCMFVLLVVILLSMYVHETYVSSRWETDKLDFYGVLSGFAIPFMCYVILRRGVSKAAQLKSFLTGIGVITLYLGLTGVCEALDQRWLVFPKYILDPEIGIHATHVRGPFVQASWNGLAMVMGLPIFLWLFFTTRDPRRWLWLLGIAAVGLAVPYSFQRAVWLGAAAAIGLTIFSWPKRGPMIVCALLLAMTLGVLLIPDSLAKAIALKMDDAESLEYRALVMQQTWAMINDHLMTGVGFNLFSEILFYYGLDMTLVSHSMLLTFFAELGLLGLLPYLIILTLLLLKSLKVYWEVSWCRPLIGGMWGITAAYLIMALSVELRLLLYANVLFFSLWAILLETIRVQTIASKQPGAAAYERVGRSSQWVFDAHLRKGGDYWPRRQAPRGTEPYNLRASRERF